VYSSERHGRMVVTSASYSVGSGFTSRLSCLRFSWFSLVRPGKIFVLHFNLGPLPSTSLLVHYLPITQSLGAL
jgi:hypothetical protein